MTHYASCGHEIFDDKYVMLSTKASECGPDGFVNAVFYGSYCMDCAKEMEDDGDVLHSEDEEMIWLSGIKNQ